MVTINTPHYLLDQARRRFTPTLNTIPGMGLLDAQLRKQKWPGGCGGAGHQISCGSSPRRPRQPYSA